MICSEVRLYENHVGNDPAERNTPHSESWKSRSQSDPFCLQSGAFSPGSLNVTALLPQFLLTLTSTFRNTMRSTGGVTECGLKRLTESESISRLLNSNSNTRRECVELVHLVKWSVRNTERATNQTFTLHSVKRLSWWTSPITNKCLRKLSWWMNRWCSDDRSFDLIDFPSGNEFQLGGVVETWPCCVYFYQKVCHIK